MQRRPSLTAVAAVATLLLACGTSVLAQNAPPGVGPNPQLPEPDTKLIPTIDIAPAEGWPQGATPKAPAGFKVTALAAGLQHPRWVYLLPNGDVLVAEANRPAPEDGQ